MKKKKRIERFLAGGVQPADAAIYWMEFVELQLLLAGVSSAEINRMDEDEVIRKFLILQEIKRSAVASSSELESLQFDEGFYPERG